MLSNRAAQVYFALILSISILLALGFSLGPILEPHDEIEHYRHIRYISDTGILPPANGRMHSQYHQAPLYYLLLAPVASLLPDQSAAQIEPPAFNPNQKLFVVGNDNPNIFIHTHAEDFPYAGSHMARAIHILRLVSVVIHGSTVVGSYMLARLLWPVRNDRQVIMTALVAFWPTLLGLGGSLNNDVLLFSLSVWVMVQALRLSRAPSGRKALILGLLMGLAILTKIFALVMVLPVAVIFLWDRRLWRYSLLVAITALMVCGWWFVRNTLEYGDPLAISATLQTWPEDVLVTTEPRLLYGLRLTHTQAYSRLWAKFGHGAIGVAPWLYTAFDLFVVWAGVGGMIALTAGIRRWQRTGIHNPFRSATAVAAVWVLATYALVVYFSATRTYGAQGRYLLMSLPAIAALITISLDAWLWRMPIRLKTAFFTLLPGLISFLMLTQFFFPAYQTLAAPMVIEAPLNLRYGESARLIGLSPLDMTASPGESITIELYWQAISSGSDSLQSYLHGIGAESFLWADSVPGNGHHPAGDWRRGERWAERYTFDIPVEATVGTEIILTAGLYDPAIHQAIVAYGPNGEYLSDTPGIGMLRVTAE